jgi:hypothetical protein
VRIVRGALAGLEGTLIRVSGETRLAISIDMIQRSIAVSVSRQDVEPVVDESTLEVLLGPSMVTADDPTEGTHTRDACLLG